MVVVTANSQRDGGSISDKREFRVGEEMEPLLSEFADLFEPLSGVPPEDRIQHNIDLVPGAKPVMKRPYRLAETQMAGSDQTNRRCT